jgi:hypothetical protein
MKGTKALMTQWLNFCTVFILSLWSAQVQFRAVHLLSLESLVAEFEFRMTHWSNANASFPQSNVSSHLAGSGPLLLSQSMQGLTGAAGSWNGDSWQLSGSVCEACFVPLCH